MPDTAKSINKQLRMDTLLIPDHWDANSIKPDHNISKAEYLFSRIKPEKAEEWRKMFGGDETQTPKEEKAALKPKKCASAKAAQAAKETSKG
ncbi:hypothetical protein PISL3812_01480 [Talaromyces islandicus]|uniref:Uncharacterized protein n=1 Tax=Talaromyces islandicus TaxID=28573 RepID=A0A0U1LMV5_TALIS|nr:hypothetical protein PISL3812_01480 [Talaromyces islandicus]